jgi:hypothetical protein
MPKSSFRSLEDVENYENYKGFAAPTIANCEAIRRSMQARAPAGHPRCAMALLANLDGAVFERLGRYEATLARQVVQCSS